MKIETEARQGVTIVRVVGDLDDDRPLLTALNELLVKRGAPLLVVLAAVNYVNSSGLAALVRVAAQANIQEQRLALAHPSAFVSGLLEVTRLERFFEVYATIDEALARLAPPGSPAAPLTQ